MAAAFEIQEIAYQKFAAPNPAIGSVARTIERHADNLAVDSVIGHATGDVRVMMLNPDGTQTGFCKRETRAQVTGVQVVGNRRWRDAEEAPQMGQRFAKQFQRFEVFQIADVLAQDSIPVLSQAERVL